MVEAAHDKKRIVLFYKALINPGGAERLMLREWVELRRLGHEVKILTFRADREALYEMRGELGEDLVVCTATTWLAKMAQALAFLRRFKCDAIVLSSGMIELLFLTSLRPVPYIVHYHQPCSMSEDDYLKYSLVYRRHFEWLCHRNPSAVQFRAIDASLTWRKRLSFNIRSVLFKLAIDRARCILVLSDYAKAEAERLFRAPVVNLQGALDADGVRRYHDVPPFADAGGRPVILTVARLDQNKRIDVGIRAFALIAAQVTQAQYLIVGSGAERARLESLIVELGLQGRCRLLGYVDEASLKRWYKTCDAFVTVDWADFRLTAFEAWAAGKQVILADEAEVNADIAATGFVTLTAPQPAPLARAIQAALARRPELDERSLAPVLDRYTWDAYARALERLF